MEEIWRVWLPRDLLFSLLALTGGVFSRCCEPGWVAYGVVFHPGRIVYPAGLFLSPVSQILSKSPFLLIFDFFSRHALAFADGVRGYAGTCSFSILPIVLALSFRKMFTVVLPREALAYSSLAQVVTFPKWPSQFPQALRILKAFGILCSFWFWPARQGYVRGGLTLACPDYIERLVQRNSCMTQILILVRPPGFLPLAVFFCVFLYLAFYRGEAFSPFHCEDGYVLSGCESFVFDFVPGCLGFFFEEWRACILAPG